MRRGTHPNTKTRRLWSKAYQEGRFAKRADAIRSAPYKVLSGKHDEIVMSIAWHKGYDDESAMMWKRADNDDRVKRIYEYWTPNRVEQYKRHQGLS